MIVELSKYKNSNTKTTVCIASSQSRTNDKSVAVTVVLHPPKTSATIQDALRRAEAKSW